MMIEIQASKSSRIRAAAAAQPDASPELIASQLGLAPIEVRRALAAKPQRRIRSVAK